MTKRERTGRHTRRVRGGPLDPTRWPSPEGDQGFEDLRFLHEPEATRVAYDALLERMSLHVQALARGERVSVEAWRRALEDLRVEGGAELTGEQPQRVRDIPTTALYAAMALDASPELADDAARCLLGPWVTVLDVHHPAHRDVWVAALAVACFTIREGEDRSGLRAWYRDKPRAHHAVRDRVRAASRAPFTPWRIHRVAGGWQVEPLVEIAEPWRPAVPVSLDGVGGVDGGPVDGGMLLARCVPVVEGASDQVTWRVVGGMVLPEIPPAALLRGWMAIVEDLQRVENRSLRREEALQRAGHRMCGWAHEWWWARQAGRLRSASSTA